MKVAGSAVMASLQRRSPTLLFFVIQLMAFQVFPELLWKKYNHTRVVYTER